MRWMALLWPVVLAMGQSPTLNATDRMIRIAIARFGRDFSRKSPDASFGLDWIESPLAVSASLSRLRADLDRRFDAGFPGASSLIEASRERALGNPNDRVALFKWGYGAFRQAGVEAKKGRSYWKSYDRMRELAALEWFLASNSGSDEYEYARLRFLVEAGSRYRPELLPLGDRLLKKVPWDAPVKRTLVHTLGTSRKKADLDRAVILADELTQANPTSPSYTGLQEYIYETRWLGLGHHQQDAQRAIEWARKYLSLVPPDAPNRAGMENSIRVMSQSKT